MRPIAITMLLPLLALAAGMASVSTARAGSEAAATLELDCGGNLVPAGVPTLASCRATATNTGSQPLHDVTLMFVASGQALPNQYYFFSAARDGQVFDISSNELAYRFSDLSPGESSVLEIEVIVRSDHDYGADLILTARDVAVELDRVVLSTQVVDPPAQRVGVTMTLQDPAGFEMVRPAAEYAVEITNSSGEDLVDYHLDVAAGIGVQASFAGPEAPPVPDGGSVTVPVVLTPAADCVWAYPAAVVRADDGTVAAAIADVSVNLGDAADCPRLGQGGGGADPLPDAAARADESDVGITLPVTGAGVASARGGGAAAVALAAGLLALAAAGALRTARGR